MLSFKGMAFSRGKGNVFLDCKEGRKEKEGKKALCGESVHVRPRLLPVETGGNGPKPVPVTLLYTNRGGNAGEVCGFD